MIPSTFTLTSARCVTYDDGVRGLILDGERHVGRMLHFGKWANFSEPVSVTVFLGRGDDMAQTIVRALTEGEGE